MFDEQIYLELTSSELQEHPAGRISLSSKALEVSFPKKTVKLCEILEDVINNTYVYIYIYIYIYMYIYIHIYIYIYIYVYNNNNNNNNYNYNYNYCIEGLGEMISNKSIWSVYRWSAVWRRAEQCVGPLGTGDPLSNRDFSWMMYWEWWCHGCTMGYLANLGFIDMYVLIYHDEWIMFCRQPSHENEENHITKKFPSSKPSHVYSYWRYMIYIIIYNIYWWFTYQNRSIARKSQSARFTRFWMSTTANFVTLWRSEKIAPVALGIKDF